MNQIYINKQYVLLLIFFISLGFVSYSQNTVTISNSSTVSLDFTSPYNPGSKMSNVSDNSKWLNYTILVTPPEPTFSISVEISSGTALDGLELRVEADHYTGLSGGQPGTPTGQIILTNEPQVLINNIGTCYTGAGINVGHRLTYSLIITNYSLLRASSLTINLTYTITQ